MPYTETLEPVLENKTRTLYEAQYKAEGQCVTLYPPAKYVIRTKGGAPFREVSVTDGSRHKARQTALEIMELYLGPIA